MCHFLLLSTEYCARTKRKKCRRALFVFRFVPEVGLEPTNLAARDFESRTFTNFVTPASPVANLLPLGQFSHSS